MKNFIKYSTCAVLFILSSCWPPRIDEKYAASVVKDKLSVSGNVSAQKLKGGMGGAPLFLATDGVKKYVVRFIKDKYRRDLEIYNFKTASDGGYGPQIYFADPSEGIVIMEYLSEEPISDQNLQSDQFYAELADLLQKIHRGPAFHKNSRYDVFKKIDKEIQINKNKYEDYIPLSKVEHIITVIHQVLLPYLTSAPCHNDLHPGNLIFRKNKFKAIDYGDAGLGEPYFDVATVASGFLVNPAHEKVLFATYLGRKPSSEEKAKLYLMKQVVLLKWAFDSLSRLPPENVYQYVSIKRPPLKDPLRKHLEGKLDLSKPENNLKFLKALFSQVLDNFESQEFKNAVKLLGKQDS